MTSFDRLEPALQDKILAVLDSHLQMDEQLFNQALKQQVAHLATTAREHYQHKRH
jgi:hypothetical protein